MSVDNRQKKEELKAKKAKATEIPIVEEPEKEDPPIDEKQETLEEKEAREQKELDDAKAIANGEEPTTPQPPTNQEPAQSEQPIEPLSEETPPAPPASTEPTPPKPTVDYKEKFTQSSREALVLASQNKKVAEAVAEADNLPEPTEEELIAAYPDWDILTDFEKTIGKETLLYKRKYDLVSKAVNEGKKLDQWLEKVDDFLQDENTLQNPEYAGLKGREDEFRTFASKPTRRNLDFSDLVAAFLFTVKPEAPKTGSLLEPSNAGGEEPKPRKTELGAEESSILRRKDPREWRRLIKAGKIKINV